MAHEDAPEQRYQDLLAPFVELDPPPRGLVPRARAAARTLWSETSRRRLLTVLRDFRPDVAAGAKLKKDQGAPEIRLVATPDILAELGKAGHAVLVGFAAETDDVERAGRDKLRRKGLQLLVANEVGREGTGFGSDTNRAAILAADGADVPMREWTKRELASAICDRLAKLLTA